MVSCYFFSVYVTGGTPSINHCHNIFSMLMLTEMNVYSQMIPLFKTIMYVLFKAGCFDLDGKKLFRHVK